MHSSGQIIFPNQKNNQKAPSKPQRIVYSSHNSHTPEETTSHLKSALDSTLDNIQKPPNITTSQDQQIQKEAVHDAKKEIVKDKIKEHQENAEHLDKLIKKSNKNLLTISTVFPFTIFPTVVSIDPDKVTITYTEFFASKNYQSVLIKEILNIDVQTDLFFGSLRITDSVNTGHTDIVKFLKKKEAIKAKRIIQGLIIGTKQGVDFTPFDNETLVKKVEELGTAAESESTIS